jgi:protein SCO1
MPAAAFLAALFISTGAFAIKPNTQSGLPHIGPAPEFALMDQDGRPYSLRNVKGKVAVVTFIFTSCSDTCPILTAKLAGVQRKLGSESSKVTFVAITVDPLNDTPAMLKKYAAAHAIDTENFRFLSGSLGQIEEVSRRYAVFRKNAASGNLEHSFLTSLIDRGGTLRLQYLGTRFDPEEFTRDLRSLLNEKAR